MSLNYSTETPMNHYGNEHLKGVSMKRRPSGLDALGVDLLRQKSVAQLPSRKDDFDSDSFRQWLIRIVVIGSGRRCLLKLPFLACDVLIGVFNGSECLF